MFTDFITINNNNQQTYPLGYW